MLAFPCNQFGHQENTDDHEILSCLKYVRPGDGYEPKFPVFQKRDVNGENADPIFSYLKTKLPMTIDEGGNAFPKSHFVIWNPVSRSDILWNFEKFLIDADGQPFRRYSRYFQTKDIADDISSLLK